MTDLQAHNRPPTTRPMRLGSVVTRPDGTNRGQVTWFRGKGIHAEHRVWDDDLYVICRSPGCYTVGNDVDAWVVVPADQITRPEKVRSAWLNWEYPTWLDAGDEPQGLDRLDWRLIEALVGDPDFEEWTGDDWPDDLALWMLLGKWIDEHATGTADAETVTASWRPDPFLVERIVTEVPDLTPNQVANVLRAQHRLTSTDAGPLERS